MSLLYPLFLAGMAAVALPILLHMIRRHTRDRVTFSSLMFLRPSLPRFRSRSKLEHVLLLILRCAVLCLLAFAFARPFLPRPAAADAAGQSGARIVLLLDTSASMRRVGVWSRAVDEARAALREVGPSDRLCLMSFDQVARTLVGFEQWQTMEPGQRASVAAQELARLAPGWAATDLGQALIAASEAIEDDEINDGASAQAPRRIVLVSDLQQGSRLEALLAYEWPQRTELVVKAIPCAGATNASLQLVTNRDSLAPSHQDDLSSIRITNSPDATRDRFQLRWADAIPARPGRAAPGVPGQDGSAASEGSSSAGASPIREVYVAAGHSTVVTAPARPNEPAPATLVLTGDDQDFDNTLYVVPELRRQVNVLYVGSDDPNDANGMLYYLRQAFGTGKALTSRIIHRLGGRTLDAAEIESTHLIVVTGRLNDQNIAALRRALEAGKPVLFVMRSADGAAAWAALAGLDRIEAQEADVARYAMLGRLDFDHPLLRPFSDPRFGDFTRIHFWKYRRISGADLRPAGDVAPAAAEDALASPGGPAPARAGVRVLARFDNDDPAWLEIPVGRGTLLVWTSGWEPADSDLALSSKFVPLLYSALEYGGTLAGQPSQYSVGDAVPLAGQTSARPVDRQIRKPDGSTVRLGQDQQTFTQADLPGIYAISDFGLPGDGVAAGGLGDGSSPSAANQRQAAPDAAARHPRQSFAVNLAAAESRTEPMSVEDLETFGVSLKPVVVGVASEAARRAARHNSLMEMESRQKLWRWVLVAVFILLLFETWLGGWLTRTSPEPEREPI
jgi:hypothetical protein